MSDDKSDGKSIGDIEGILVEACMAEGVTVGIPIVGEGTGASVAVAGTGASVVGEGTGMSVGVETGIAVGAGIGMSVGAGNGASVGTAGMAGHSQISRNSGINRRSSLHASSGIRPLVPASSNSEHGTDSVPLGRRPGGISSSISGGAKDKGTWPMGLPIVEPGGQSSQPQTSQTGF